jgi:hypothetical protein
MRENIMNFWQSNDLWVCLIMLIAGLLGGGANYFLEAYKIQKIDPDNQITNQPTNKVKIDFSIWSCLFLGVSASFLLPLVLSTISSNLLSDVLSRTNTSNLESPFVFFSFCLICAISSRALIKGLSDKILDDLKETREKANTALNQVQNSKDEIKNVVNDLNSVREELTRR